MYAETPVFTAFKRHQLRKKMNRNEKFKCKLIDLQTRNDANSFPTINDELIACYVEMLNHELVDYVNADITYTIAIKDMFCPSYSHDDDALQKMIDELPYEFKVEYHHKRDRVHFFNSSTMSAEMQHIERKREELSKINNVLTIEHEINLCVFSHHIDRDFDNELADYYEYLSKSPKCATSFMNQLDDKEYLEDKDFDLLRKICSLALEVPEFYKQKKLEELKERLCA